MAKYINADETIKAVREQYLTCDTDTDYGRGIQQGFDFAMSIIRNQPTADVVEVKHGKWEYVIFTGLFKCSHCGEDMIRNVYPFCTWCGADMRERKEAENG